VPRGGWETDVTLNLTPETRPKGRGRAIAGGRPRCRFAGSRNEPEASPESMACAQWLQARVAAGSRVGQPAIADCDVRPELLRTRRRQGLRRPDALIDTVEYLPLTTAAMRQAAVFWAEARQRGRPTAEDKALDGDIILPHRSRPWGRDTASLRRRMWANFRATCKQQSGGTSPQLRMASENTDGARSTPCTAVMRAAA